MYLKVTKFLIRWICDSQIIEPAGSSFATENYFHVRLDPYNNLGSRISTSGSSRRLSSRLFAALQEISTASSQTRRRVAQLFRRRRLLVVVIVITFDFGDFFATAARMFAVVLQRHGAQKFLHFIG